MYVKLTSTALALLGTSALVLSALAQAPAASPPPEATMVKTFATLPSNEATENICQLADGSIFVSVMNTKTILKIAADGKVSEFASAPAMAHLLGLGCGDNEVVAVFFGKTFRGSPPVPPATTGSPMNFSDTDTHVYVYDLAGKLKADIPGAKGEAFNGFAYSGTPGLYYAGNSANGSISTVDTNVKKVALWWKDDSFAPSGNSPIGINGVRVQNSWVYLSGPTKKGLWKIKLGSDGKPSGEPIQVEDSVNVDDFDVAKDGSIYFTTGAILYRAAPDGTLSKVAEPVQGGPSALVSRDGKWVYWPTRGGSANQRLVRVPIA